MKKVVIQKLWKDSKRHCGLPLSLTRYSLSEDRLFMTTGLLSLKDEEVLLYRVTDISMKRGLIQRLFGVGTITVFSSDKSMPQMVLENVKDPVGVKEIIHRQVEQIKQDRNVRMSEVVGAGDHDCHHHDGCEGI